MLPQPDQLQLDLDHDVDRRLRQIGVLVQRQRDVLGHGHAVEQGPALEQHADRSCGTRSSCGPVDMAHTFLPWGPMIAPPSAPSLPIISRSSVRLARAAAAEDDQRLALADVEVDLVEHRPAVEPLGHVPHPGWRPRPPYRRPAASSSGRGGGHRRAARAGRLRQRRRVGRRRGRRGRWPAPPFAPSVRGAGAVDCRRRSLRGFAFGWRLLGGHSFDLRSGMALRRRSAQSPQVVEPRREQQVDHDQPDDRVHHRVRRRPAHAQRPAGHPQAHPARQRDAISVPNTPALASPVRKSMQLRLLERAA